MKKKIFLVATHFLFATLLIAQNRQSGTAVAPCDIAGTVWGVSQTDSTGMAVPGANIRLLSEGDSILVKGMATDPNGKFVFTGIRQANYIIAVSFMGYATYYKRIPADYFRGTKKIDLGKVILQENSVMLSEAVVTGQAPEVVLKQDTIEYTATTFKMQEGAVVEDLLKRLPGVEVEPDGKVTSAGKQVKRVFVNGKEFFGNDPKMATKNLTVDMIDKVQVVEKKSDLATLTGVDDGETETVINLTIKKNMNKGWIGNVSAGVGELVDNRANENPRYNAQTLLNRFEENSQLSFIVNANNLNNQGFTDDGNTVRSGFKRSGGSGITNSNSFGFNASTVVSDKLKIGGDIRYNYTEEVERNNSFRTNLLIDSVSYRKSRSADNSYSHNLAFNAKMEYKPDSMLTVVFSPQISYNASSSNDISYQSTLAGDIDSTRVNQSDALTGMNSSGLVMGAELTATRRFARKGRRLSFRARTDLNYSTGEGTNMSTSEFFLQQGRNKYLNQESGTSSNSNSYSVRASYVEPLRENMTLQVYYDFRRNNTRNIRKTFDFDPISGTYSKLNSDYSKSLANDFINQTIGLSLNGVHTKYNYNVGVNIVPSFTQSTSFIKDGAIEGNDSTLNRIAGRKVINYAPQVNFTYRFTRQTNLRFTYRGNTRQPSVTQLDPTPNNTNPLNIRTGNPDLLPAYTNSMSLRFNSYQRERQQSLMITADYDFTLNEIINFTAYESETGIQHTSPINENGSWTAAGNIMYNSPIGNSKRFKFSTNTRVNYNNRIGYTTVKKQSQRNLSGTLGVSENLSMSYSTGWFYGQLMAQARYSNTANSLEGKADQKSTNYGITYNTQLTLPWSIGINSDINYRATRGLSAGYNKDEVLWNAAISKQFLKGNRATLRVQWIDILQQRLNISRNVTANYIEDSEYNALTSYVLVSFSYRFNSVKGASRSRQRTEETDRPSRDRRQSRQQYD